MSFTLPGRTYRHLDRATKVLALVLLAAALAPDVEPGHTLSLIVLALAVGVLTVFVRPTGQ